MHKYVYYTQIRTHKHALAYTAFIHYFCSSTHSYASYITIFCHFTSIALEVGSIHICMVHTVALLEVPFTNIMLMLSLLGSFPPSKLCAVIICGKHPLG